MQSTGLSPDPPSCAPMARLAEPPTAWATPGVAIAEQHKLLQHTATHTTHTASSAVGRVFYRGTLCIGRRSDSFALLLLEWVLHSSQLPSPCTLVARMAACVQWL